MRFESKKQATYKHSLKYSCLTAWQQLKSHNFNSESFFNSYKNVKKLKKKTSYFPDMVYERMALGDPSTFIFQSLFFFLDLRATIKSTKHLYRINNLVLLNKLNSSKPNVTTIEFVIHSLKRASIFQKHLFVSFSQKVLSFYD